MSDSQSESLIAGIDLGTTQSLIGVVEAGFPILLADESGSRLTPSAVYFGPEGAVPIVGQSALRRRLTEPARTVTSVKRLIGRRAGESEAAEADALPYPVRPGANGELGVPMDGRQWSPVEISAEILRHLKAVAERALEKPVNRAVITVPAYFNDAQRQATRQAGALAGFTVERILNEPTAAALAFGLDKLDSQSRVAVYDLGGGTFDISILELNEGVFQVLATHGDTRLGGDDLDAAFAAWLTSLAFPETDAATLPPETRARLHEAAITAKHALSFDTATEIQLPFLRGSESFVRTVPRVEFETLARPILDRTRALCLRALADAKVPASGLSAAVLVGGSTRIPLVRDIARDIFGREPDTSQHPDETVALGAVIQAGILSGAMRQVVLLDVTPLSLGMETFGGLMNVILPRNTTIPARAGEMFTNAVANQSSMRIRVLQGEREMARDNWELGQFEIDFEPGPKASARVGVQFEIDADGILKVLARDTKTHTDRVLEITHAAVDVDDARVEQMIAESVDHAFDDMTERQLTEAGMKARELLTALDAALPQAGDDLDEASRTAIESAAAEVRAAMEAGELPRLKAANQKLDAATESLAAILVERAMEAAMVRRGIL